MDDGFIDLERPGFTRGMLVAAETAVVLDAFASDVAEVLGKINDGKEATVYLCRARDGAEKPGLLAAKIYRARKFRAFSNDQQYIEPNSIRDRRLAKAVRQRSKKGRRASHFMWVDREWAALSMLFDAGASVPEPISHCASGILMEYVGGDEGPAPMLSRVKLEAADAENAFAAVLDDVRVMLECELIHGDLSAFNILYLDGRPRLIDLPQAMDIGATADPWPLFYRDVDNICQYFSRQGLNLDPLQLATQLWRDTIG